MGLPANSPFKISRHWLLNLLIQVSTPITTLLLTSLNHTLNAERPESPRKGSKSSLQNVFLKKKD